MAGMEKVVENSARGAALHRSSVGRGKEADSLVDHTEIDQLISFEVADDPERFETLLDALDLLAQKFSELDDPFIADAEVFSGAVGEQTLSFPRHRVLRRYHVHLVLSRSGFEQRETKRHGRVGGLRAGCQRQSRSAFFDAVFEANEFVLLGVFFYARREMRGVAV